MEWKEQPAKCENSIKIFSVIQFMIENNKKQQQQRNEEIEGEKESEYE